MRQPMPHLFKAKSYLLEVASVADRNMMLTVDEFMALKRLLDETKESEGASLAITRDNPKPPRRKSRKQSARSKKLSKALEMANADFRKKNGDLKKGKSQSDVMTRAHSLIRRGKV